MPNVLTNIDNDKAPAYSFLSGYSYQSPTGGWTILPGFSTGLKVSQAHPRVNGWEFIPGSGWGYISQNWTEGGDDDGKAVTGTTAGGSQTTGIWDAVSSIYLRRYGLIYYSRFKLNSVDDVRLWAGFTSNQDILANDDPAGRHLAAVRYSSGVNGGKFSFCTKDGATINTQDSNLLAVIDTVYAVFIYIPRGGNPVLTILDKNDRGLSNSTMTVNLPGNTTAMNPICGIGDKGPVKSYRHYIIIGGVT